jgi:predicted phage-related endonuclease
MTDYDLYMSDVIYENKKMEEKEMENEIVKIENNEIMVSEDVVQKIIEFKKLQKEIDYQEKLLKQGLMEAMQTIGKEHFSINGLSATIRKGSKQTRLDTTRLKTECPDIYEEYSKTSETAPSLILTVND